MSKLYGSQNLALQQQFGAKNMAERIDLLQDVQPGRDADKVRLVGTNGIEE